jgi:hypothetical protein
MLRAARLPICDGAIGVFGDAPFFSGERGAEHLKPVTLPAGARRAAVLKASLSQPGGPHNPDSGLFVGRDDRVEI